MNKRTSGSSQLPNAPLVEVVFELRWQLKEDTGSPRAFWSDPGYSLLAENFGEEAKKRGFKVSKKMGMQGMLLSHNIALRYYKEENQPFPIWQIGPGIFAANESAAYEWNAFKKLILDGVKHLLSSYPKMKSFPLQPNHLELRYTDSIDSTLAGHQDLIGFLNEHTSLSMELPTFFAQNPMGKCKTGNLELAFPIIDMENTEFSFRVGTGQAKKRETMVVVSKVSTISETLKVGNSENSRLNFIEKWSEKAHSVTSSFFKEFASDLLMNKFRTDPNA